MGAHGETQRGKAGVLAWGWMMLTVVRVTHGRNTPEAAKSRLSG